MEFTQENKGDYLVVHASGRMDATTAGEFEAQCDAWVAADEKQVVVEMGGIEYISSAGLRSILTSAKKLKAIGGEMRFAGLSGMVADVFKVSGFAAMFKIFASLEQALEG